MRCQRGTHSQPRKRGLLPEPLPITDTGSRSREGSETECSISTGSDLQALLAVLGLSVLLLSASAVAARSMSWLRDSAYGSQWQGR